MINLQLTLPVCLSKILDIFWDDFRFHLMRNDIVNVYVSLYHIVYMYLHMFVCICFVLIRIPLSTSLEL